MGENELPVDSGGLDPLNAWDIQAYSPEDEAPEGDPEADCTGEDDRS